MTGAGVEAVAEGGKGRNAAYTEWLEGVVPLHRDEEHRADTKKMMEFTEKAKTDGNICVVEHTKHLEARHPFTARRDQCRLTGRTIQRI